MGYISSLKLNAFRSYDQTALDNLPCGPVIFFGDNGAGKTNILEAVSLLTPGRGLRGAALSDIQNNAITTRGFAIAAEVQTDVGIVRLGTGLDPLKPEKRQVRIQGETAKSQTALGDYLTAVWLTPQMDRLFIDSAGTRRRFFDRMVASLDPAHTGRITRYENALAQRSKLLRSGNMDDGWLGGLEETMAHSGLAIAAARVDFLEKLMQACTQIVPEAGFEFPLPRCSLDGYLEGEIGPKSALAIETQFKQSLKEDRKQDAQQGGASKGIHRTDFKVVFDAKSMPADQCSTGEQKALLTTIILGHARLLTAERGFAPLILLDEIPAHLDERKRDILYNILLGNGSQLWLTGTDIQFFNSIAKKARIFEVKDGIKPV